MKTRTVTYHITSKIFADTRYVIDVCVYSHICAHVRISFYVSVYIYCIYVNTQNIVYLCMCVRKESFLQSQGFNKCNCRNMCHVLG